MQTFLFLNQKAKSLFHDRKRPAKIAWTVQFRKAHKKVPASGDAISATTCEFCCKGSHW